MNTNWEIRLTVVGEPYELEDFHQHAPVPGRFPEWVELSDERVLFQFECVEEPISEVVEMSRLWPTLVLMMDSYSFARRTKGLVIVHNGAVEQFHVRF